MIEIFIDDQFQNLIIIKNNAFNNLIKKIFKDYNHKDFSINYILTNDKKLNSLKNSFFNENVLTDVIAFNLEEPGQSIEGEIYISLDRVKENASLYKQNFKIEFCRVIIHGTLHLLGFNDKTKDEKQNMTDLENRYIEYITSILK